MIEDNPGMPTRQDIERLASFLDRLYGERTEPLCTWRGGEPADGAITMPWPEYAPDVMAFFQLAGSTCWSDFGYRPREASEMLADEAFVNQAGLEDIKTMLTYCVRGERFVTGFWEQVIVDQKIRRLLERLVEIRLACA